MLSTDLLPLWQLDPDRPHQGDRRGIRIGR
jgi:hypothetical protein